MKLLMHICCAVCSIHPFRTLRSKGIDVRGFWFNPNIHPFTEYAVRLESLRRLQRDWNLDITYDDTYGLREFVREVVHREDDRCAICYAMRLDATAENARRMGLDGFTTTLLVSPYQNFETIVEIGGRIAEKHTIPFHREDFRPGWRDGMKTARELGVYRQKYCGCIYSEMERYLGKDRSKRAVVPTGESPRES